MAHHIYILIAGVVFGLANVIPGVSGGTMAVVFGVYERIIDLIANLRKKWKQELPFICVFGAGAVLGILGFGKIMKWVLAHYPTEANAFFIGIILGSIPMLVKLAVGQPENAPRRRLGWNAGSWYAGLENILPMLITFAIMVPMALAGDSDSAKEAAKAEAELMGSAQGFNLGNTLLYILYGAIAVSTMIIPGISGSFVMLLLGFYSTIIGAVADLNLWILLPFALGCVLGVIFVTKLIKWVLNRFAVPAYSAILGFVLGSVLCIFPGWSEMLRVAPLLMVVLGIAAILLCNKISPEA